VNLVVMKAIFIVVVKVYVPESLKFIRFSVQGSKNVFITSLHSNLKCQVITTIQGL